jgi:hypothetical protein
LTVDDAPTIRTLVSMHQKLYPPYFGIAGISSPNEIKLITDNLPARMREKQFPHRLAIGVLATEKTIAGHPASKPKRYPPVEAWRSLVVPNKIGFGLIHYGFKSGSPDDQLAKIPFPGNFRGIQWNAPLDVVKKKAHIEALAPWAGLRVVLQLRLEGEPDASDLIAIARAHQNRGAVTDFLLDASAGKAMNVDYVDGVLKRFFGWFRDEVGIGVAGGLRPGAMSHVLGWLKLYPRMSVDIETGARDEADDFSAGAAVQYLDELAGQ